MGVRGLQSYILAKCPDSLVPVDLTANTGDKKKRLIIIEGWSCLRSVYGPHMDFICGGQWQEFRASIRRFVNTFQTAHCELVVFFSGGIEEDMRCEWARRKSQTQDTVNMVMQGLRQRGYAPDRKHFLPNETHPQVFRQVLLSCHVKVISTPYSTDKAMVEYAHKHGAYGILANDSDFIMMNAPRYLSLHHLRISGNTISTVIVDREKISSSLELPLSLFPLLSCLLGNDVVNFEVLDGFHKRLLSDSGEGGEEKKKKEGIQLVTAVTDFLKALDDSIKMDISGHIAEIVKQVLPNCEKSEEMHALFLSGLEQYKESNSSVETDEAPVTKVNVTVVEKEKPKQREKVEKKKEVQTVEAPEEEVEEDKDVQQITELVGETKIVDEPSTPANDEETTEDIKTEEEEVKTVSSGQPVEEEEEEETEEEKASESESEKDEAAPKKLVTVPAITSKVLQSAKTAHISGTLNTHLYPLMCTGTFSLAPLFEDAKDKDVLSSALLYRTARQRIYGLVFGIGRGWVKGDSKRQRSTKIDTQREVTVKEYIVNGSKKNLAEPEEVAAIPVHAPSAKQPPRKPTPHIDRLWIGMSAKIQELRRSTLLAVMNSNIPSFCNPSVIANEYLLVCMVLRYILTTGNKMLREYELDAFLATALSPQLHLGPSHLYKINPGQRLTSRGCSLAHVFVRGVETALLANDACNYPINLRFCFIGNFFDGKLFQLKLAQARAGMSLLDVCDGELYAVDYLRHLRCVITEELPRSVFAPPPPGPLMQGRGMPPPRGAPIRGAPIMGDPARMKYSEPPRPYNGHQGNNRGMYRPPQYRSQYRPPYPPPPPVHYNQRGGGGGVYNNNHQYKQYSNRRYPNNYEQGDNYSDNHGNYNKNYNNNNNYMNGHQNYNSRGGDGMYNPNNGPYMPGYKAYHHDSANNGYYNQRQQDVYPRQSDNMQRGYNNNNNNNTNNNNNNNNPMYLNKMSGQGYKDNDPYGKRNVPDRSDTKQWINFLGN